jgi:PAS domain-containing protein
MDIKVNPAFINTLGYTKEILSSPITSFIHPEDIENLLQSLQFCQMVLLINFENRLIKKMEKLY